MCVFPLLFLLLGTHTGQTYLLADARYPLTRCDTPASLPNALGTLTLANDVLAQRLLVQFGLNDSFASCYLCEQYPAAQYCAPRSVTPDHLYLALDTLANVQLLLLDAQGTPLAMRAYQLASDLGQNQFASNASLDLNAMGVAMWCGARYALLLSAILTLDEPQSKDLYALLYAPNSSAVPCRAHPLLEAMNIDCTRTPLLYPVQYETRDCIGTRATYTRVDQSAPPLRARSPLYWFTELALNASAARNDTSLLHSDGVLCGEPLETLMLRTTLYQAQCYGQAAPGWWDTLLIGYVCALLDAAQSRCADNAVLHMALEERHALLERTCDRRDYTPQYAVTDAIAALYVARDADDTPALCETLRAHFEAHYGEAHGEYTALVQVWGRSVWTALVYPSKLLATKTLLFALIVCCTLCLAVSIVGVNGFKLRIRLKRDVGLE